MYYKFLNQYYFNLINHIYSVVVNVFIAIIEESYLESKMHNKNHWIHTYLDKDKKQASQDDSIDSNENIKNTINNVNKKSVDNSFYNKIEILKNTDFKSKDRLGKHDMISDENKDMVNIYLKAQYEEVRCLIIY